MFLGVTGLLFHDSSPQLNWPYFLSKQWLKPSRLFRLGSANWVTSPLPLAMTGGDPYIRALMRTISASESNMDRPYYLLYGGRAIDELSQHPDNCIPIETGPNVGDCTTAAGRYQFLTTTWQTKAQQYHPAPPGWFEFWQSYDFSPESQDIVVYRWLSDPDAWGTDISQQLKNGEVTQVLELLSGTWTSLGYGIETNSMSSQLPSIYGEMLQEELAAL
ncbi:MAG: glycoside hydrolase family protein [Leptolyngbya sp. SIO3F4]|nr:glycoside hydrolase family protein [Leptolyngbya sp. SIO3F4]